MSHENPELRNLNEKGKHEQPQTFVARDASTARSIPDIVIPEPIVVDPVKPGDTGEGINNLWGFFFSSATLTDEQEKAILAGLYRVYQRRTDITMASWDIADPNYGKVQRVFGIKQPPAFVVTKAWFGQLFRNQDWNQILSFSDTNQMPVHVVLQGPDAFKDVTTLVGNIEQLNILFAGHTEEIENALRARKFGILAHQVGDWTQTLVKNVQVTFSFGGATTTIGFDKNGAGVNVGSK